MNHDEIKVRVQALRKQGKTFSEIQKAIGRRIPKSTLSYWCSNIALSELQQEEFQERRRGNLIKSRKKALLVLKGRRKQYLASVDSRNTGIEVGLCNQQTAKLVLGVLYLAEGGKNRSAIMFGNSDPGIIQLFLSLLRFCYSIQEDKFRCTVQLRSDQNQQELINFWSRITKISTSQFYASRVDQRSKGKKSKNQNYRGVCRVDYLSADLFHELTSIGRMVAKGP